MLSIYRHIYALPEPPQSRSKPLRVICLGLPRTGTDSLNNALQILGFDGVSHGLDWWIDNPHTGPLYIELANLKSSNKIPDPETLRTRYFDRLLGDKEATTDIPSVWFAEELLKAYPEAKVVLNRRRDILAWKESFRGAILPILQSWRYWLASWFDASLFWCLSLTQWGHTEHLFHGDFESNAEKAYNNHYNRITRILNDQNRDYLDWSVEDGWKPLCDFLDVPQPEADFPSGNTVAEFYSRLIQNERAQMRRAKRHGMFFSSILFATIAACVYAIRG